MRAVIQRVSEASVEVQGEVISEIGHGLLILLGIEDNDEEQDINWLASKIINMRIFNDEKGVMNKSIEDVEGEIIVVSQFTLYASTRKGNRPSYIKAARPEKAIPLYQSFIADLGTKSGKKIKAGIFGEDMKVRLLNDGPVTIIIDSKIRE